MSRSTTPPGWPLLAVCAALIYVPRLAADLVVAGLNRLSVAAVRVDDAMWDWDDD